MSSPTPQPSPELVAVDLLRSRVESMGIEELEEHVASLRSVLTALVQSLHLRPDMSVFSEANIERLIRKVRAKLSHSLDVLCDLRVAAAWLDAEHQEREKAGNECRPSRLDA
jgi:hypothetical protein